MCGYVGLSVFFCGSGLVFLCNVVRDSVRRGEWICASHHYSVRALDTSQASEKTNKLRSIFATREIVSRNPWVTGRLSHAPSEWRGV